MKYQGVLKTEKNKPSSVFGPSCQQHRLVCLISCVIHSAVLLVTPPVRLSYRHSHRATHTHAPPPTHTHHTPPAHPHTRTPTHRHQVQGGIIHSRGQGISLHSHNGKDVCVCVCVCLCVCVWWGVCFMFLW